MKANTVFSAALGCLLAANVSALSLAPEEFKASRDLACVLAQQSLGYLSEDEYGSRAHTVLENFDAQEQDTILAKALGYYDGLMFLIDDKDTVQVSKRLEEFVDSAPCADFDYQNASITL
tara:strand:+ start:38145 stop:38504 length:360 start_codon:yes stop_codon:yes gene_type:complete